MKKDYKKLVAAAIKARNKAYAPYSKFQVGAALLTGSGEIVSGANVENVSYGLTICAERVAVVKAVSEGKKDIAAIAVVFDSPSGAVPCGACLQVLGEFGRNIDVVSGKMDGSYTVKRLSSLIPYSFKMP